MRIGANLFGLGDAGGKEFKKTAPMLAEYGYRRVEPLVMFACDRKEMEGKDFVPRSIWQQEELVERSQWLRERFGIVIPSIHFGGLPGEDFSTKTGCMIDILQNTDVRDFVISRMLASPEQCRRDAAICARAAEAIAPYGGRLLYHNHESELVTVTAEGKEQTILDYFLSLCPENVLLQADVGWVMFAGADPDAFLREHSGRIACIHLKDFRPGFRPERREKDIVAVGEGALPLADVLAAARELGLAENLIIDQDCSQGDLMDDLRRGFAHVAGKMDNSTNGKTV